jgi:hypothetical protein
VSKARAVRGVGAGLGSQVRYVLTDPEVDNFTYDLGNLDELAEWAAAVGGGSVTDARGWVREAEGDQELHARLLAATRAHPLWSKPAPPFGKRLGWYALARALKPQLIVETGVHDGLGALLLLRALERNAQEGTDGRLVSFDINPAAGWLVGSDPRWTLHVRPTDPWLASELGNLPPVGMFIHDSLHTYENEHYEMETVVARLAATGVLISDNAHVTPALREVAAAHGLDYREFRERPARHFYTGGIMAAAYPRST